MKLLRPALWVLAFIVGFLFLAAFLGNHAKADTERRELAKEIYNFLGEHAICFYENDEPPCDWFDDAYELHRAARDLYSSKPLGEIAMPESDWSRGAYKVFDDPIAEMQHQLILEHVQSLIFE